MAPPFARYGTANCHTALEGRFFMAGQRRLVVATSNPHKVDEFRAILSDIPFDIVSLAELGLNVTVEETGVTFADNAILKAIACAEAARELSLADDSGIEVDALDGEPGIRSNRWAGEGVSPAERNRLLNERLVGVPDERRMARFRCAIAIAGPAPLGLYDVVEGTVEGRIVHEPRGSGGFGYDPIFYVPELGRTVGELPDEEKNRISHRARAAAKASVSLRRLAAHGGRAGSR